MHSPYVANVNESDLQLHQEHPLSIDIGRIHQENWTCVITDYCKIFMITSEHSSKMCDNIASISL